MGIIKLWENRRGKPTLSFEFYPAHDEKSALKLDKVVDSLVEFHPDFVSVTFGAGGTTREGSYELVKKLLEEKKQEVIGYIAAYGLTPQVLSSVLDSYKGLGVENILCIRGDKPAEEGEPVVLPETCFSHASDFIEFVKPRYGFTIGAAGYPEGHLEAVDKETDLNYLKLKVEKGAQFIITQYSYDTNHYIKFVEKCRDAGIRVPIITGIMPIYTVKMMENLARICGAKITKELRDGLAALPPDDKEAVTLFGMDYAYKQCKELIAYGVDGIHFYTMDRSGSVVAIVNRLRMEGLI